MEREKTNELNYLSYMQNKTSALGRPAASACLLSLQSHCSAMSVANNCTRAVVRGGVFFAVDTEYPKPPPFPVALEASEHDSSEGVKEGRKSGT